MSKIDVRDGQPVDEVQYSNDMKLSLVGADIVITNITTGKYFTIGTQADLPAFAKGVQLAKRVWGN